MKMRAAKPPQTVIDTVRGKHSLTLVREHVASLRARGVLPFIVKEARAKCKG